MEIKPKLEEMEPCCSSSLKDWFECVSNWSILLNKRFLLC
jgi:hypothetical protein